MINFKKGQTVRVYEDPESREVLEGVATLVKREGNVCGHEFWWVRFDGDAKDEIVYRRIN